MPHGRILLRLLKTLTLHGVEVEQLRPLHILDFAKYAHQFYYIMPIRRTNVADVHTLKHILLICQQRLYRIVEAQDGASAVFIEPSPLCHLSRQLKAQAVVEVARLQLHQVGSHAPDSAVDAHIVVVENDEHVVGRVRGIVESLKRQPAAHRTVANNCYHALVQSSRLKRRRSHAQRC